MCERDSLLLLEEENNHLITQLRNIANNSIPQAPPPTQVEDVENKDTILNIQEENKTITFQVDETQAAGRENWPRRKARRQHRQEQLQAKELILQFKQTQLKVAKWKDKWRRKEKRGSAAYDTAATSTCVRDEEEEFVDVLDEDSDKKFLNANGSVSSAGKKARLRWEMREPATEGNMVPDLAMNTLVSAGKVADANYISVFTKDEVKIFDAEAAKFEATGKVVMTGWRCPETKLWRVPLQPDWENPNTETALMSQEATEIIMSKRDKFHPDEFVNSVYELPNTEQVVAWYHAAAGYPTKATWLKAINAGFYATWPLLTAKAVRKHFPEHTETDKGHMKRVKSGVRSTKVQVEHPEIQAKEAELAQLRRKHRDILVKVHDIEEMIYTDQTGAFPVTSSQGHKYIMVLYEVDGNYIAMEPMKARTTTEMIRVYTILIERLKSKGIRPARQMLDNEAPREYLETIEGYDIEWELTPANNHRMNIAERAIQTAKGHIIANMLGVDENFPMQEWHRLLPQIELTLNMLRASHVRPTISAHTYVHGIHDYKKMPLGPLGCATQSFVDPDQRKSFGEHSVDSWYIGTSPDHYRSHKVFVRATKAERITDTIVFKHRRITSPYVSAADTITAAAAKLTEAVTGNLVSDVGEVDLKELKRLAEIFERSAKAVAEINARAPRVEPEPRVEPTPRVPNGQNEDQQQENATDPRVDSQAAPTDEVPPLIQPNGEVWTEEMERQVRHRYNTRLQKRMQGNATTEAMLSMLDVTGGANPQKLASRQFPITFLYEVAGAVLDEETGDMLEYRHLVKNPKYRDIWSRAFGKEIGRLAQGQKGVVEGTDAIKFIKHDDIPPKRRKDLTYVRICANYRPEKADPYRIRITAGGNLVNYPGDVGTRTADMLTVKLLLNSVVSTPGAKFMSLDISNFYLMAPMDRPEYMQMNLSDFPDDIIEEYNLREIAKDGKVIAECQTCVYGLPQSGILANKYLEKRLNEYGFYQSQFTNGLWLHKTRSIQFALTVDDFGVKYVNEDDVKYLCDALTATNPKTGKPMFEITVDMEGKRFCGLHFDWDYENREVHVSIPGYVKAALTRFQHERPEKPQYQPYPHNPKQYGAKAQYAEPEDTSPLLNKDDKRFIQEVTGTFLFYARAVDPTMLVALGSLASEQANPTQRTMEKCKQFLDYAATQEEAVITYRASDMILAIHSDASYLSEPKARSRAGGHFFLSENTADPADNGAVHTVAKIIKAVMSSAAEAELGGLFYNAKTAVPIRTTLEELGHKQPPTPIQTDNSTACGVVNNEIQPKATKAMDMRFYWLKDREARNQFKIYWRKGKLNRGDYVTKHHSPIHHKTIRPTILTPMKVVEALRKRLSGVGKALTSSAARVC